VNIPFFFKQWGGIQKKRNGRMLDGRTYDGMPTRERPSLPDREYRKDLAARLEQEIAQWVEWTADPREFSNVASGATCERSR